MQAAAFHVIEAAVVAEAAGLVAYVFLVEIVAKFDRIRAALRGEAL